MSLLYKHHESTRDVVMMMMIMITSGIMAKIWRLQIYNRNPVLQTGGKGFERI